MKFLVRERPLGSEANAEITGYLETELQKMGYSIQSLPFACTAWEDASSSLAAGGKTIAIQPSPFSMPFEGTRTLTAAGSLEELKGLDCRNTILLLGGELSATPLQPKNYPFYYPDEHKQLIELLEEKSPAAILAATGKHPLCGLDPYPLFEDGNFLIPSAYVHERLYAELRKLSQTEVTLAVRSKKTLRRGRQIVAAKKAKQSAGKIIICAHMDTKYHTPGALDNAAGVAVALEAAKKLDAGPFDIEIVPMNGEEHYEACGELAYLRYVSENPENIVLFINIDSPCHTGSDIAVSLYNFPPAMKECADRSMRGCPHVGYGAEWYAGDHAVFAFRGTPCMAVASSDLFEGGLSATHTMKDTPETVDSGRISCAAEYIAGFISCLT
ncbi:MAG: M28 family peptidase [Methanocorpusculum sp.]|nr:M28 family peptidase [Methanocorpusculum sp.]